MILCHFFQSEVIRSLVKIWALLALEMTKLAKLRLHSATCVDIIGKKNSFFVFWDQYMAMFKISLL